MDAARDATAARRRERDPAARGRGRRHEIAGLIDLVAPGLPVPRVGFPPP